MRKTAWQFLILMGLALAPSVFADERANGWCEQGGHPVTTGAVNSSTQVQQSYPRCTITVYQTGTTTPAVLYSDNGITPLANPFTANQYGFWAFYATNGVYDIQLSGGGIATPFTIGAVSLFDVSSFVVPSQVCGVDGQVQFNQMGAFGCSPLLTFNYVTGDLGITTTGTTTGGFAINTTQQNAESLVYFVVNNAYLWSVGANGISGSNSFNIQDDQNPSFPQVLNIVPNGNITLAPEGGTVNINGITGVPAIVTNAGFIQSAQGFLDTSQEWNAFQSSGGGFYLRGGAVAQSATGKVGGYIDFVPINYNPNGGGPCTDANGNPVQQPLPLQGNGGFGVIDTLMWVGTSPQMPPTGCGPALPINTDQGLFINSYLLAEAGLATTSGVYNAINAVYPGGGNPSGGVTAGSITAGTLYPAGTLTTTGTLGSAAYLGGYMAMGHATQVPGNNAVCVLISACTNPLSAGDGVEQGTFYFSDATNTPWYYNGTSWVNWSGGGGGGGNCTLSGVTYSIQINNPLNSCYGDANLTYVPTGTPQVTLVGNFETQGAANGFNATQCTSYNCLYASLGGGAALSFTASSYVQVGSAAGAPTPTGSDAFHAGAMSWDTNSDCSSAAGLRVYNGSSWTCLGTGGGGGVSGALNEIQFYGTGGVFSASANLQWCQTIAGACAATGYELITTATSATAGLAIANGFAQTDGGFLGSSLCTNYNCFSGAFGGMAAKSFTAANYVQTGNFTGAAPAATASDAFHAGALSWSITSSCEQAYNGASWGCIGGGGGSTPGGPPSAIQFNNGGALGGTANFEWNNTTNTAVITTVGATVGLTVVNGYAATSGGYQSLGCVVYNCYQSLNSGGTALQGGMAGLSFTAVNYINTGSGTIFTVTPGDSQRPGTMFYNTSLGCEQVYNGSSFNCLASGSAGVSTLNGLGGSVSVAGTANEITVATGGGCPSNQVCLSTPQPIGTASNVTFGSVVASGAFNSTVTGSTIAFQTSNTNFQVDGNGNVSATTQYNTPGVYKQNGVVFLDASRNLSVVNGTHTGSVSVGSALSVTGISTFTSAATFNGGLATQIGTNSSVYIGAGGNLYNRVLGSSGISCSGISDGWTAVTNDDYVVVCLGSNRFRAALVSY
jgi:hypothetical protein